MNIVTAASKWLSRSRSSLRSRELLMLPTAVKAASASISTSGSPETSCTRNWAASALAPQAVALDAGRQVVSSGCVPLVIEPQGNEPSLEFGHGTGESAAGIHLFVPESLVALE